MVVSHWESAVMSKPQDLHALESTKIILSNEFSHSIDRLLPLQTCCIFEPSMGFLPQWRLICRLIEINGPQITSNQPRHPRQIAKIRDGKVSSKSSFPNTFSALWVGKPVYIYCHVHILPYMVYCHIWHMAISTVGIFLPTP